MSLIPSTANRVPLNTAPEINHRIKHDTDTRIAVIASRGRSAIEERLKALENEWDIERCLETGASSLTLLGTILAFSVSRKWLWLPGGVATFLLQHAIQGWCPPLPVFRRLGVRTIDEINYERNALQEVLQSSNIITH